VMNDEGRLEDIGVFAGCRARHDAYAAYAGMSNEAVDLRQLWQTHNRDVTTRPHRANRLIRIGPRRTT